MANGEVDSPKKKSKKAKPDLCPSFTFVEQAHRVFFFVFRFVWFYLKTGLALAIA